MTLLRSSEPLAAPCPASGGVQLSDEGGQSGLLGHRGKAVLRPNIRVA